MAHRVYIEREGKRFLVGGIAEIQGRYKFIPFSSSVSPSRKLWETPEAAVKGRIRNPIIEQM